MSLRPRQTILEGDRTEVKTLISVRGTSKSFVVDILWHRVTRVSRDSRPRHAAIFAYTAEPGVIGRLERTRQLFGRVLPAHEEAESRRVRSDELMTRRRTDF